MESKSPHFWWIICTLSVTIIGLVSFILSDRIACAKDIMDYTSYASVILSITLSVFAILYTYTSNVQIQQQFEKINAAANNMTATSDKLTSTNNKLNENLDTILEHLKKIDTSQREMNTQLNNINSQIPTTNLTNNLSGASRVETRQQG